MIQKSPRRTLGVFSLIMMTVGSVDSIRNLPSTALFGAPLIFFFVLAALIFLLPSALVSAELASSADEDSGIYGWVKHAFGDTAGMFAIWFQWIENVIFYPTLLSFITATLAYVMAPQLMHNRYMLVALVLTIFWLITLLNCRGIQTSALFANICAIIGLLLPMALIIVLGVVWVVGSHPLQIPLQHVTSWLPDFSHDTAWVSLTAVMLSFSGIEISAVHSRNVLNPQRSYPLAMLGSTLILVMTLLLGSLAIAVVLPAANISLVGGMMQAYHAFLASYHLLWLLPMMGFMIIVGGLGAVNNWIIAPCRGLLIAAEEQQLPAVLATVNRYQAPYIILIGQAVLVSVLCLLFIVMPSINETYMFLNELTVQLYMVMYALMFAAVIKLRLKRRAYASADVSFRIPGGILVLCLVAGLGVLAAIGTITIGFFPPPHIIAADTQHYQLWLLLGFIIFSLPPCMMSYWRRRLHRHHR